MIADPVIRAVIGAFEVAAQAAVMPEYLAFVLVIALLFPSRLRRFLDSQEH